jgi:hypothetical protein
MNRFFILLIFLGCSFALHSQLLSEPLKIAKDTSNGLIYTLPKTIFEIEVDCKKTVEQPGIYYQYAERFLGIKDFIQTENTTCELTGFRAITKSVADTSQVYVLSVGKKNKNTRVELTSEGFLKSINSPNPTVAPTLIQTSVEPQLHSTRADWATDASSIVIKEMQMSSSTAKMAEIAANQLFSIREARINLLKQDVDKVPGDGRSYELVLSELNRMEKAYLELFVGTSNQTVSTTKYVLIPEKDTTEVLLRFSLMKGIVDKQNLGGEPVYIQFKKLPLAADSLRIDRSDLPKSLYYRAPSQALVNITDGKNTLFSNIFTINQFGKVIPITANQVKSVELSPITGGLLKISN